MSLLYPNYDSICEHCGQPFDSWSDLHCPCQAEKIRKETEEQRAKFEQAEAERLRKLKIAVDELSRILAERTASSGS